MPSAVAQLALDRGFPEELIFTPERAREESFLSALKEVEPDVCITAAYGNILPQKFLDIPSCGWCCRNRCFPCIYCPCIGCRSSDCV
ncbi:Methionyl-tRNA formyltransferase [Zea mays]|uniref:Methionyl-tRNA formyltransferase n=1 Tax=Zea mays TaxID=4577 RepID=A0A1D6NF96_MAIZE|nr:Methionyl-tRNA formyltransferase [Zea mays]